MSHARSRRRSARACATSSRSRRPNRAGCRGAAPPEPEPPRRRERRRRRRACPRRARHPPSSRRAPAPGYDEDPWLDDERDEVPADEALQPPRARRGADGEEDVLEETPDFLQETPEHDRLWFEQKPPQDFDWDK